MAKKTGYKTTENDVFWAQTIRPNDIFDRKRYKRMGDSWGLLGHGCGVMSAKPML